MQRRLLYFFARIRVNLLRNWGLWWRGLLCLTLGLLFFSLDESSRFDTRFQLRGQQNWKSSVVTLTLLPQNIQPNADIAEVTDSFYWDKKVWLKILTKALNQNPKKIAVTFFFSQNIDKSQFTLSEQKIFFDPRIIWATSGYTAEGNPLPLFTSYNYANIGTVDLVRDQDGVIRTFAPLKLESRHMIEALTGRKIFQTKQINYRGNIDSIQNYSFQNFIGTPDNDPNLNEKYIIIGPESSSSTQYLTPLGPQNRPAVVAQMLDNELENRWIKKGPWTFYFILFILLEFICVLFILQYPHIIALVFLFWISTLLAALSAWTFDSFYFWIPVFSPALLILTTWIIFIGNQANRMEEKNSRMHQEQEAAQKLEQLKNNFVSLISHDLKTPLAKMSAVLDRLKGRTAEPSLQEEFDKLSNYTNELNRYLQSILKVLRLESREFKLQITVDDINSHIESAVEQIRPLSAEKKITLELQLEPLFSIEADFPLIREVILNILENAVKYSHPGGKIKVHSTEAEDWVIVSVIDNGPGIAADEIEHIWGKFNRGKDQDLKTKGSGLGLYLVRYFVELHGGKVGVESKPDSETRVFFQLPIAANTNETQDSE